MLYFRLLFSLTLKSIPEMKPLYLLLLVLIACGFYACTPDQAIAPTEFSPRAEGNTMDAASFAELTDALAEFGLFSTDPDDFADEAGSEDFRIHLDEEEKEITLDFLTKGDGQDQERSLEEILASRPVRNWSTTLTLRHDADDAERFRNWLTDNFSGTINVDVRLTIHENGALELSGLVPTAAELARYPEVPLF